ncbi:MAG TPA: bifunctional glutamate N-acetyltransferase/amino-acid acetyltransferase ArgJ [Candidatus Sulfotelmatobacter sp.]|jgi:glutamate N-acetyltransferase/amino-acid N-acetyltransferase|nr:bifunctional glutamate N-acetyltransferase/amino-acid acetyltransferase ArgJ [Bryobacteraceae bacterium]
MRPFDLPLGYKYATAYAGIRKQDKDDLALIVSGVPAAAAAVFTTNRVQAAPVRLARANMRASKGVCGAILVNAGNANCATKTGDKVAANTTKALARLLKLQPSQVLPASTGVIGVELDETLILNKLPELVENLNDTGLPEVARAILTTDLQPKGASREVTLRRGIVRLAGITKGSGMIHPRMATTLAFVMTDAVIPQTLLRRMLVRASELSYNRISVDGDTSTNDTLIVLANGASGVRPDPKEMSVFEESLTETLQSLARQIVRDGEGARKLIAVEVHGALSDAAAASIARAIALSPLVKTAIAGSDPNWGRILSAAGNASVSFDPTQVDIILQEVRVCRNGLAAPFDEGDMKLRLDDTDVSIVFRIAGKGKGSATFWTCDLTEDYIHINASYRT